ncbi:hypothetical protein DM01DRAFT_1303639 [Hesseltinella vesiculosa]|uniref:Amino acid transporter transmembrane domain-containing protein n=1 Tax=Hesseltinella vesiculosa TaxID=101127 RepID=A0A1X2GKT6_9FUNG|nr:hypothetical protein DM01DRAFT_1303639 [Hesseltinella vesiculosa]
MSSKGIGAFGSTSLLVSSMTGPGLATIPAMFQQSGWLVPTIMFIVVGFFSGCAALFVCEALSNIRGNEKFQAKIELTTVAQVYLGKKYHFFFQFMLFMALQAVNISSIIIAAQTFDGMIITLFKGTCGLGINPGGWFCATSFVAEGNSPFAATDYYIFTFGFLLTFVMVVPLGFFTLTENIVVQMVSFVTLIAILIQWLVAFGQNGLNPALLPPTGANYSSSLGIVIFNFAYITTIPCWVNSLKPDVNVHRCIWISVIISAIFYMLLGIIGGMSFPMSGSSDILTILGQSGVVASQVTCYLFPIVALVSSIPVFTIVIRSNLIRGQICSRNWAIFLSNFLPWFVCIPLQTKDYVGTIQNWSSLFFQSTVNYILPMFLYFVSRRIVASVSNLGHLDPEILQRNYGINPSIKSPDINAMAPGEDPVDDKNDVIMYNPEQDCSISIRRSSIQRSHLSRLEHQSMASPRSPYLFGSRLQNQSVISQSMLSPPTSPRYQQDPHPQPPIPTIVYNENDEFTSTEKTQAPGSPSLQVEPHPRPSTSSGDNGSTLASARGLGITDSTHPSPQQDDTLRTTQKSVKPKTSGRSQATSTTAAAGSLSPDMAKGTTNIPPSPQLSQNRQSMIASVLSVRSSIVAPYDNQQPPPLPSDEKVPDYDQVQEETEEEARQRGKFIAFHKTKYFNPLHLAILCCGLMSFAIVFMILYDIIMLGLGNDVFG